ncbi:hypothetical protein GCM10010345_83820 [Streptomyces canarius]|uniref:Transposase IS111A/IS1328/IS1533 N-terminal domain-containing protein n=1 Tax=Streptomyces canarius TaxID=285453 RepID=A0ABQ3DBY6_9ACTN|nr:hypothetical protein GCM10010345_83820 [Streptomyces canarius]
MAGAYRGEAKTDARDAYFIAETARRLRDFTTVDAPGRRVLTRGAGRVFASWGAQGVMRCRRGCRCCAGCVWCR